MKQLDDTRTRAERSFQRYLDLFRNGKAPGDDEFVAGEPDELRAELRNMLADYHALRERLGEHGSGLKPGRVIADYRLVREIGRGGMAEVWEAEQLSLKRTVALKLLAPHHVLSNVALQRFQREARAGGRLAHPCIVQIHGVGQADGLHFIAQELVPGGYTLADSLGDLRAERELPTSYYKGVAELFFKIAGALQYAHEQGVVHRDVKPSNILLSEKDEPKVADFGLARIQDELALSRTGELEGTPYYMSPEQAAAKSMGIDHRTDVFSLGSTLYEALTLTRAFEGDTSQLVFRKILTVDPVDPRTIRSRTPRDLAVICMKALEKNPERRFASMAEFAADLRRYLDDEPIRARPTGILRRAQKWALRRPILSTAGGIALVAASVITWQYLEVLRQRDATDAALEAESLARRAEALERERAQEAQGRAESEALRFKKISAYLQEILAAADPEHGRSEGYDNAAVVLERARELFGDDHALVASCMSSLSFALQGRGELAQAEELARAALPLWRQAYGEHHPALIVGLSRLADLLEQKGDALGAEQSLRDALALGSSAPAIDQLAMARTRLSLVRVLAHRLGGRDEAQSLLEQVLATYRNAYGPTSVELVPVLDGLATLHGAKGEDEACLSSWREELEILRHTQGRTVYFASNLNQFGSWLTERNHHLDLAEAALREAIDIEIELFGEQSAEVGLVLEDLSLALRARGDQSGTLDALRKCARIYEHTHGRKSREHVLLALAVARMLEEMNSPELEGALREAVDLGRGVLGDDPSYLTALNDLTLIEIAAENIPVAKALYAELMDEAFASQDYRHGTRSPNFEAYAKWLTSVGDPATAIEAYTRAIETADDAHPQQRDRVEAMAQRLLELATSEIDPMRERGEGARALAALKQAAAIVPHMLGGDHFVSQILMREAVLGQIAAGELDAARALVQTGSASAPKGRGEYARDACEWLEVHAAIEHAAGNVELSRAHRAALDDLQAAERLDGPRNLDFEEGSSGSAPSSWRSTESRGVGLSDAVLVDELANDGTLSAQVLGPGSNLGMHHLSQDFDARPYRGRRVRFSAAVRTEPQSDVDARLWINVRRAHFGATGLFDNMRDRPIRSAEWQRFEITGRIDDDARWLTVGMLVFGTGKAWMDSASFEVLDPAELVK